MQMQQHLIESSSPQAYALPHATNSFFWPRTPSTKTTASLHNITHGVPAPRASLTCARVSSAVCRVCLEENKYVEDGYCQDCPDSGSGFGVAAALCCAGAACLAILFFLHEQTSRKYARVSVPLRKLVHYVKSFSMSVGLLAKVKLMLTFAQVIAALDKTYDIGMPPVWFKWTAILRFWGDINWTDWVVPSKCLISDPLREMLLRALIPLAVVIAMPLIGAAYGAATFSPLDALPVLEVKVDHSFPSILESRRESYSRDSYSREPTATRHKSILAARGPKSRWQSALRASLDFLPLSLVIAFCFTPSVSANIFGAWHCPSYYYDNEVEHSFLASDLSIRCDSSEQYSEIVGFAWLLIAIWPVGMVAMYAALLFPCRNLLLDDSTDHPLVRATSFLHRDYKPGYFWWEVVSLIQRTTLTGWLLLIDIDLRFIRLLAALILTISFLVILLALKPYKKAFDYSMAAGCQILLVCIFIGGVIVRLFEDISNDPAGSKELAIKYLGLQSSDEVIIVMIAVAFVMLGLLTFTLLSESYVHILQQRMNKRWSVCTIDPPYVHWKPDGIYACFLSHYKLEAASDARYMHDMLRKMLKAPVFLDSSALNDLRNLITEGVHKSDVLVLLVTKGVLSRPWCLLEILETSRKGIPVVLVHMETNGMTIDEARAFAANLEDELQKMNPAGLEFLMKRLGNLDELKDALSFVLESNGNAPLIFGSHAGDNAMVATMKDVVERMAKATGRELKWKGTAGHSHHKLEREEKKKSRFRIIRNHVHKTMSNRFSWSAGLVVSEVNNKGSTVFVCCSRDDAVSHARVLRSELQMKLGRSCAIGGGDETDRWIEESQLGVVLLTKRLLENPIALFEAWGLVQEQTPIVTVAITGGGYDYELASAVYADLPAHLTKLGKVDELARLLPDGVTVADVGTKLDSTLTSIIALPWTPAASKNQLDALVDDIISRIPKKKHHHHHHEHPHGHQSPRHPRQRIRLFRSLMDSRATVIMTKKQCTRQNMSDLST